MERSGMKVRFFCIDSDRSGARVTEAEALSLLEHGNPISLGTAPDSTIFEVDHKLLIAEASGVDICLGTLRLSSRIWH